MAAARLSDEGHQAVELSFHQLLPLADAINALRNTDPTEFDRVVFVSPSSVAFSQSALAGRLDECFVAAIGQGSATVLVQSGLVADDTQIIRPRTPPFDSAALSAMDAMDPSQVQSMLVVRGTDSRNDWIESYRSAGTRVDTVEIYQSEPVVPDASVSQKLGELMDGQTNSVLVVGSISEFKSLNDWLSGEANGALRTWIQALPTVVPHGRIAAALTTAGWQTLHTTKAGQTLHQAALELA
jgi:uroporphyrinogen-III synthase